MSQIQGISQEEARYELEWRRCARDPEYFMRHYVHIRVPGRGRILLDLREAQLETLSKWQTHRYTITLKARQIGFSTLVAAYCLWVALFHSDKNIVMFSKGEREAAKLLAKSKYAWKHLPQWMKDRAPTLLDNSTVKMSWSNDSIIESLPSGEDPGRSEAVDIAVIDEWAFLPNPEDAWASIEPITDVGGNVIGISTANGSGNFFHNQYVGAKTQSNEFHAIFFPWSAHDDRDEHWYAAKARNMTEQKLHQEYPRDDEECFVKSGAPVFDLDTFSGLASVEPVVGTVTKRMGEIGFVEMSEGNLRLYEKPRPGRKYVIGADVAEGREHGDWSVATVIDAKELRVVAVYRAHVDPDVFGDTILPNLGYYYNTALVGVEANNHGNTTCMYLRDNRYPNIYYRKVYDQRFNSETKSIGWLTTAKSKPLAIDTLRDALRDGLSLPDTPTIEELRTYKKDENGRMSGSPFDDHVMALAIANMMIGHVHATDWVNPSENFMTMQWYLDNALAEGRDNRRMMHRSGGFAVRTTPLGY